MSPAIRTALAVVGVALLAAAAVIAFVVVPARAQLPEDTSSTRIYEGQVATMLDGEALAAGDIGNVMRTDLPIRIEQQVEVTGVADGVADVTDGASITLADGTPLLETEATYSVDRRTMQAQGDAAGLVIGWPIDPAAADATVWSGPLQTDVPAVHEGTEEHAGIQALRFTAVETGRIVDEAWLETVPAAVPTGLLGILATTLDAPAEITAMLDEVRPTLPAETPLAYLIDATTTYWVHPTTGMVIDADVSETRSVVLDVPGMDTTPVAPVLSLSYQGAPDSVASTVEEAEDLAGQLALFRTTVPLALVVAGAVLLLLAALGRRRSRPEIDLTDGPGSRTVTVDDAPAATAGKATR